MFYLCAGLRLTPQRPLACHAPAQTPPPFPEFSRGKSARGRTHFQQEMRCCCCCSFYISARNKKLPTKIFSCLVLEREQEERERRSLLLYKFSQFVFFPFRSRLFFLPFLLFSRFSFLLARIIILSFTSCKWLALTDRYLLLAYI